MGNTATLLPANTMVLTAAPCIQTVQQVFLLCQLAEVKETVLPDILVSSLVSSLVPSPAIT